MSKDKEMQLELFNEIDTLAKKVVDGELIIEDCSDYKEGQQLYYIIAVDDKDKLYHVGPYSSEEEAQEEIAIFHGEMILKGTLLQICEFLRHNNGDPRYTITH